MILLAIHRDAVAVERLAHQAVWSHNLARLRVRCERVAQRHKREVHLFLLGGGGALDVARGGIDSPASSAHVQDLGVVVLLRHGDRDVLHDEGRLAGHHPLRAFLEAVHERRRRHVGCELDADGAAGNLSNHLDKDVRHKGATHLEVGRPGEEKGARLEEGVDGEAAVVEHRVEVAVLATEVCLATVRKVQVWVAGEAARLEGRRRGR